MVFPQPLGCYAGLQAHSDPDRELLLA